ncbi:glycoside hydrolase family 99-like domain-containing protein [Ferruginibacter paludis]|uniref:glycoside hydrolase family 99-like domain-containing protein n=1 Tax=Ferruginibacter paludis TaxID=1310417 RepID=UPI0025B3C006|nr:glycoside hydrolase family 99-like domain-containing protein [Ferruginibacter paludis]MDN3657199.1 glycoside hydrolase family 99-like domain-containing protein [Ferruginibacter paludis]
MNTKNGFTFFTMLLLFAIGNSALAQPAPKKAYEVAVYYFPNYHVDSINERWHGKGWTEWDLVKISRPRFEGHLQPKVPTWGYFNEADPVWATKEIDAAADNGIDVFIYDWYWYEPFGQYLQEGLEKGFLKAPNNQRLKFALMWANHNWANIHPTPYTNFQEKLTDGKVSASTWNIITDYIIEHYFKQSNYWKIDGKPYFSIFETTNFIASFGSLEKAGAAMQLFEDKVKKAGFPGLHFNCIDQGLTDNSVQHALHNKATAGDAFKALKTASLTSYNFLYAYDLSKAGWPTASYQEAIDANSSYWPVIGNKYPGIEYYPNVTMGWDVTPRLVQSDKFDTFKGYPWTPVFNGDNTPEAFQSALVKAKAFVDLKNYKHKIVILNAWNEWTEGSYLLPEERTGTKYLEAIKNVFGKP